MNAITSADFDDKVINSKEPVLLFIRTQFSTACTMMELMVYK